MSLTPNPIDKIQDWPITLPMEIAMRIKPAPELFKAYGYGKADWDRITHDPAFQQQLLEYAKELEENSGASFRMKARLQADTLLGTSWDLIHGHPDVVPASVKASLIQSTVKWAGLEPQKKEEAQPGQTNQLMIRINL